MLKDYIYKGAQYQFEEGEQPEGAVELKSEPPTKADKPNNKARKVSNK